MCDCYGHKCEFCENVLSIHIADYCVKRKEIIAICPDCQKQISNDGLGVKNCTLLFVDIIDDRNQIDGKLKDGKYKGKSVLFFSKDSRAYGVRLN